MKYLYRLLLVCVCLGWLPTQAQNWRPFRPNGDVHAFRGASPDTILTLRLDSAGVTGTDSVYYFNRIMRRANSFAWQKARNNQFGQQLRYNAAQRTYALFWNGGPSTTLLLDYLLVLKPFAPVGSTWNSAFTDYGVTTTLISRGTMLLDGVQDSVATFRAGTNPGVLIVLSKNNGLVSGPANLLFGVPAPKMLTLARRPAPAGLSYYNPLTLLDLQPGDELGYRYEQFTISPFGCATGYVLRRVLTRQLTNDSIIYVFQNQWQTTYSNAPGCSGGTGTVVSPVSQVRAAASLRTGEWRGQGVYSLLPPSRPLLTYAYTSLFGLSSVLIGHPVVNNRPGMSCGGSASLMQEALYQRSAANTYQPGLDALARRDLIAQGVGLVLTTEHYLIYSRRTINGTVQTCGSRANFGTLLPTKVAQRTATFQLYPNPAANSATLVLPAPSRAPATIRLLDGLGRIVRSQQLAAGQSTTTLPLQGLATGVYVVEMQQASELPQRLRLQHQE